MPGDDTAILTRDFAERLFGKENPIGKVLVYGEKTVVVRGVIDVPSCKTTWRFGFAGFSWACKGGAGWVLNCCVYCRASIWMLSIK